MCRIRLLQLKIHWIIFTKSSLLKSLWFLPQIFRNLAFFYPPQKNFPATRKSQTATNPPNSHNWKHWNSINKYYNSKSNSSPVLPVDFFWKSRLLDSKITKITSKKAPNHGENRDFPVKFDPQIIFPKFIVILIFVYENFLW